MFKIKDDSYQFKPILTEIEESPVSPLGRIIFWLIIAFIIIALLWLFIGKIDIVVSARGKIIPFGEIKVIQPLEAGVVKQIFTKEGDFVKKGQVLMEVDPSTTQPQLQSLKTNLEYLNLESKRLNALSEDKQFEPDLPQLTVYNLDSIGQPVQTQMNLYRSSKESLQRQLDSKQQELKKIDEQLKSAISERNTNQSLLDLALDKEKRLNEVSDLIAKNDLDEVQANIKTYSGKVTELEHKLKELNHAKSQTKEEMNYLKANDKKENLKELSDRVKQTSQIQANIQEIGFKNKLQRIASPVDGYVNKLFIHTVGGVVTPAEKLISVVPINTPLVIQATVLNKDIGFVKSNMPVQIKIDTFDFQKYGLLKGVVLQVSKDSIEDQKQGPIYEVYIEPVDKSLIVEGKRVFISSGMSLSAEIKVGKRRIIEFFVYPLIKYWQEGISVR